MTPAPVLALRSVSKQFRIYRSERTLFRYVGGLLRGENFYETLWALKSVDLEVRPGEKVALIGRNGSGKSTLLRLATGIYQATSGRIERNRPALALFSYGVGAQPELPVVENILLIGAFYGIPRRTLERNTDEILSFAGIGHLRYQPVKRLSAGQAQRLNFSIFLQADFSFLVLDESTSMADAEFCGRAARALKTLLGTGRSALLATHQLDFAVKNCDRAVWLESGSVRMDGPVREVVQAYQDFCGERPHTKISAATVST